MWRFALVAGLAGCDAFLRLSQVTVPVDAPVGPVQEATGAMTGATTLSATLPAVPAAGNVLVMVGASTAGLLTSVTGGGVTWQRATESPAHQNIEIWFGATDGTSSTVTITCETCHVEDVRLDVTEWAGLDTTNTLDASMSNAGDPPTPAAATVTTTQPDDLLIFGAADSDSLGEPGAGWTELSPIMFGGTAQRTWFQRTPAIDTFAPAVTAASSWDAALVALRVVR